MLKTSRVKGFQYVLIVSKETYLCLNTGNKQKVGVFDPPSIFVQIDQIELYFEGILDFDIKLH